MVAQRGRWRSPESGDPLGEAEVASHFRVQRGRIIHYARYDALDEALRAAGREPGDEVA